VQYIKITEIAERIANLKIFFPPFMRNRNKIKRKIRACIKSEEKTITDKLVSGNYMILFKGRNKKDESFNSILENLQELVKQFSLKNLSI